MFTYRLMYLSNSVYQLYDAFKELVESVSDLAAKAGEIVEDAVKSVAEEVKDGAVVCKDKDGKVFEVPCDSVIGAVGYIPAPLTEKAKNVYLVGDCLAIGNLRSVIWRAYEVAMNI